MDLVNWIRGGTILGEGGYGTVYLGKHKHSDLKVAIKTVSKERNNQKYILNEVKVLRMCTHVNIVEIYDYIDCGRECSIVLEYVNGGDLLTHLNSDYSMSEKSAYSIFKQIVSAVTYLHNNKIAHRDLKCENVMIGNNGIIKLIDFGFSYYFGDNFAYLNHACGTVNYTSPELILNEPYDAYKVDIWALGIILYALVTSTLPFVYKSTESKDILLSKVLRQEYILPSRLTDAVKDLIKKFLQILPDDRISLEDICEHEWFKKEGNLENGTQKRSQKVVHKVRSLFL